MMVEKLEKPYVRAEYRKLTSAIVIAPTPTIAHAQLLKSEPAAIFDRAHEQHEVLVRRLAAFGTAVHTVVGGRSAWASAAADLAVVTEAGAVLLRPSDLERRSEVAALEDLLNALGVPVLGRIDPPGLLDGGDILIAGDTVYIGVPESPGMFHRRSNEFGRRHFADLTGLRLVEVSMSAIVPRLRSVASIADVETVILGGAYTDAAAFTGLHTIMLPAGEELAAGMIMIGERRAIANVRFAVSPGILKKAKIAVESIDLWEFGKLGMAPSMLVLALKRP